MRFFVPASITRGPLTKSPYSAVLLMLWRIHDMPPSNNRSTISLVSCKHSKYAISGA